MKHTFTPTESHGQPVQVEGSFASLLMEKLIPSRHLLFAYLLPISMLLGAAAVHGQVTDFESFALGTVHYQGVGGTTMLPPNNYIIPDPYGSLWTVSDEWGFQNAPLPFDEEVKDDGTGNQVLRLSNAVTAGGFSNQTYSPSCAMPAGETTSALYNDRGLDHTMPLSPPNPRATATSSLFHSGLRFKSATGAAQPGLVLSLSPAPRQSSVRMSFVGITDNGSTGFDLNFFETLAGGTFSTSIPLASDLSYTEWHQLDIYIEFVDGLNGDGSGNDIVTILLNGVEVYTGTTWETFYASATWSSTPDPIAIDALMIRSGGTAVPANAGNGIYFDDVVCDNAAAPVIPPTVHVYSDLAETMLVASYTSIQAAIDAASTLNGYVVRVDEGVYNENVNVNKDLVIRGANSGIDPNTGVRVAETIIEDGGISVSGANTVSVDGFHILQISNSTPVSLGSAAIVTLENCIVERNALVAVPGGPTGSRGVEISGGAGAKNIRNNLFTGDPTGGLFSGTLSWNSGMYINGPSNIVLEDNVFENCRTGLNIDDDHTSLLVSGNTFDNNGTHASFGGAVAPVGSYTWGPNDFKMPGSALINLSNVGTAFRLDISAGTFDGTAFSALSLSDLFNIEAAMFHRGRSGRNGLVYYVADNLYVRSDINALIQPAIEYAASGDVINIMDGTYNERLTVSKSLTLDGQSNSGAILNGTGLPGTGSGITVSNNVTDVTIRDLTIQNYTGSTPNTSGGIYAPMNNNNLSIDQVIVQNNTSAAGFYANGPIDNLSITNSTIANHGPGARGIVVWNGHKTNITITGNTVTNNNCCGIELQDGSASAVNVSDNTIDIGGGDNAIGLTGMNESVGPNVIDNNTITGGGRYGIEIKNPAGGVTVSNNSVSLTTQNADLRDRGGIIIMRRGVLPSPPNIFNVDVPNGVTVTGNTVDGYVQTNPGSVSEGFGIVVEGTNHVVTGNTVQNCDVGIIQQQNPSGYPNDADQSNIADAFFGRGNAPQTCGNTINSNVFNGNGEDVRHNPAGLETIGSVVNINTNTTYCSIQSAIDASATLDGHTLAVESSIYAENVDAVALGKDITFSPGNSSGCVTIDGDFTLDSGDILDMEIDGITPCTEHDQFVVSGVVSLGGATLNPIISHSFTASDQIVLISSDNPISGTFEQGSTILIGSILYKISYTSNQVVLSLACGDVCGMETRAGMTISTQTQLNNFLNGTCKVTHVTGNLTLDGNGNSSTGADVAGTDPITDLCNLSELESVSGNLIIRDFNLAVNPTNLSALANLKSVGGALTIGSSNANDDNASFVGPLSLPALEEVGGTLTVNRNPNITSIHIPTTFISPTNAVSVLNNTGIESGITLGVISTAGNVSINSNGTNVTTIEMPELSSVGGSLTLNNNAGNQVDAALNFANLQSVANNVGLNRSVTGTLNLPVLNSVGGSISIDNNNGLVAVQIPTAFTGTTGAVSVENNIGLTSVVLGVKEVVGSLTIDGNGTALTTLSLPELEKVSVHLEMNNTNAGNDVSATAHVSMPKLTETGGRFRLVRAANTLTIPLLRDVGTDMLLTSANRAFIFQRNAIVDLDATFPTLETVGGNLNVSNNVNLSQCCIIPCKLDIGVTPPTITGNSGNCSTLAVAQAACTPDISIDFSPAVICPGAGVTLTFNDLGNTGGTFSITATLTDDNGSNSVSFSGVTNGAMATYTEGIDFSGIATLSNISVYEEELSNCTTTHPDISVSLLTAPTCNVTGASSVCPQTTGLVYSAPAGLSSYAWNISGNGSIQGAANGQTVTVDAGAAGTFELSLTVTDANGCESSCLLEVDVEDVENPTVTCPANFTANVDADCEYLLTDLAGASTAMDNCGVDNVSQDMAPGTPLTVGTHIITVTVEDVNGLTGTCTVTVEVEDDIAPAFDSCPADISVEVTESSNPAATGVATATDNCDANPTITFADVWAPGSCLGTGVITRTWTATDASGNATSTCVQEITIVDTEGPEVSCPADITVDNEPGVCEAEVIFSTSEAWDKGYNEGWEESGYVPGSHTGWNALNSSISDVPSGTNGVVSKSGTAHGLIDNTVAPQTGLFGRLGGYTSNFGNGFRVRQDVYMDLNDPAVLADTYGWDLSVAANRQNGSHLRDFIFHTASNAAGEILVGGSNNTNFTRRNDLASINHHVITQSDWYTFEWLFYDNGMDVLAVDLNLLDKDGVLLWTETRSTPADIISTIVGGNRYIWFTFIAADYLAIDNTCIERRALASCSANSGDAFPVGTTTVTCTATDDCGNEGDCSFTVTVNDAENPVIATCPIALSFTGCDESAISGPAFSATLTPSDYATFSDATNQGDASDNCAITQVSYQDASAGACPLVVTRTWMLTDATGNPASCQQTITILAPAVVLDCPADQSEAPFQTQAAIDAAFANWLNTATVSGGCNTSLSNDAVSAPPATGGSVTVTFTAVSDCETDVTCTRTFSVSEDRLISGTIFWEGNGAGVDDVTVDLTGDDVDQTATNPAGEYSFIVSGSDFNIEPSKSSGDLLNGVTVVDVQLIQEHVVGNIPITDPYKLIAADVNLSQTISTLDALIIAQAILGNPVALSLFSHSWRFVDAAYVFPDPLNPWVFPSSIDITGAVGIIDDQDFVGVKMGDVNASGNPSNLWDQPDPRSGNAQPMALNVADREMFHIGEIIEVPFRVDYFQEFTAFQFGLYFDVSHLELIEVLPGDVIGLQENNFGLFDIDQGHIRALWWDATMTGQNLEPQTVLFTLKFRVKRVAGQLSHHLYLNEAVLVGEAYTLNQVFSNVVLNYSETDVTVHTDEVGGMRLELLQNRPNPFTSLTHIGFHLPDACEATLRVLDLSGRQVWARTDGYQAGYHEIPLRTEFNLAPGVYFYELVTPFGTRTRKMILQ